jgi:hypothetical protein
MSRWHIACQWNGQAARLVRNKCRGHVAQRPYVRLRLLAYVTCTMPRGSIGAPPKRGAEAYTVRSGHVSASDPRLALIKAWVFSVPESWDLAMSGPDPTQRGLEPILGVRFAPVEVLDPEARSIYTGVRHFPMEIQTHCSYLGVYHCRRFETGGSLGPTSECRRVPQPRWVEREGEREGGRSEAAGGRRERGGNPAAFVFVPRPGRVRLQ